MLVTSIFSLSYVFYPSKIKFQFLCPIYFAGCKCFDLDKSTILSFGKELTKRLMALFGKMDWEPKHQTSWLSPVHWQCCPKQTKDIVKVYDLTFLLNTLVYSTFNHRKLAFSHSNSLEGDNVGNPTTSLSSI